MLVVSEKVGAGTERVCYVHPHDQNKAIKIPIGKRRKQTDREISYYQKLSKRKKISYSHIPQFYGVVSTNLGEGYVVDLVRDYDGEISKPLKWYFQNGYKLNYFSAHLSEFKEYFLKNRIIFNYDMNSGNVLVKKLSPEAMQLVVIDGLGDVVYIEWPNIISAFVRLKIERRWKRFLHWLEVSAARY